MSYQVRRDRSRFNPQQTWVPRGSSTSIAVVNEPSLPPTSTQDRSSESLHACASTSRPGYLQRQHNGSGRNVVAPHPHSRHRRDNNATGTLSENRQRVASRNQGKRLVKEENIVFTDPNLPQLVQEIQEKLVKSSIECMICYDKVNRSANIWSCSSCYSIFHMHCIKRWARAPTSIDLLAEKNQGDNWRCPGCQSVQLTSSREICYLCFCGKRKDPPSDPYLTPHSCGEPCGKPLEKDFAAETGKEDLCPHVCVLQCHPGPCPPCKAFAPPRSCPCGKKMFHTRCSERRNLLVCGQRCEKPLNCGRHRCEKVCHVGTCDPCQVLVNASCFCKKKVETVVCGDMIIKGELKAEDGVYSCSLKCGKGLGCGNHFCSDVCHPGPCGDCDLLPSRVKTCYCGKTLLEEQIRGSCLDPVPSCSDICMKLLPCGLHTCTEVCHSGDCPPCLVKVNQKCRCKSTSRKMNKEKVMILAMMIFVASFLQASRGLAAGYGEMTLTGPGFFCRFVTVAPNTAESVEIRLYEAAKVVYMAEALQPCQHLIKQRGELMMLPTAPSRELRSFFVTKETVQLVNRFTCRPGVEVMRVPIRHIDHIWYGLFIKGLFVFTSFFLLHRFQF